MYSRTCLERPLKFPMKIGGKRQVALQKRGEGAKINIKSMELYKNRFHKIALQGRWPSKAVIVNDRFLLYTFS